MRRSRARFATKLFVAAIILLPRVSPGQDVDRFASYRIGPRDLVSIEVLEDASLNTETRVTDDGTVELRHVDPVAIAGLTANEASLKLSDALEKYLQRATVDLRIIEFRSQPITVLGAVRRSGPLPFSGRWTLIDAITEAGGLTDDSGGKILVLRRASNGLTARLSIDASNLLERGDPEVNIALAPNDLINVTTASNVTVFCMGEVSSPGAVVFKSNDRITLLALLARVGGLAEQASNRIIVRRADSGTELSANYKSLLAGRQPDIELEDGDLVIVKESFF